MGILPDHEPDNRSEEADGLQTPFIIGWMGRRYEGGLEGLCSRNELAPRYIPFFRQLVIDWFPHWVDQHGSVRPRLHESDEPVARRDAWTTIYSERMASIEDPDQQSILIRLFDQVLEDWQAVTLISDWAAEHYAPFGGLEGLAVSSEFGLTPENAALLNRFIVEWFPFWVQARSRPELPFPIVMRDGQPVVNEDLMQQRLDQLAPWIKVYRSYLEEVGDPEQQRIFSQLLDRVVTDWQSSGSQGNNEF